MEETEAIARLKEGDICGLEALVCRYQVQAVRTAYLITHDRALAEDIVQSAFLRAYERIAQFDSGRPFGPWFLRSVVHDAVKATARRERLVSLDTGVGDTFQALLVAPDPDPARLAEVAETRQAVWAALGKLPPAERAAVVMRFYLGWSEAEMAAEMDCPPGTVKWRLHTARKRLQELLRSLRPAGPGEGGPQQEDGR
jgi:RNA polymerase sigma-70 factor (ECF subfamily)